MKKICIVAPITLPVPNVKGGAIETLITNLIEMNELEKNLNLTVISIYDKQASKLSKKYKHTKVIYIKKNILTKGLNFIRKILRKITKNDNIISYYYKKIFKIIQKEKKFDYIIAEGTEDKCFRYLLNKTEYKKEQLIAHIHYHRLAEKELDDVFGKIIVISKFVKKEWLRTSENKKDKDIKILMNGIDLSKFDISVSDEVREQIRNTYGFRKDDFIVIYCGRIIKEKGVKELIKAIEHISDKKVKLLIVGSPNFAMNMNSQYLKEVKGMVNNSNHRIRFTGYIDNSELYKYYKASDIMVVPSIWEEAAGLVCIEGMITQRPLIITKSGGMIEYVLDECAIKLERNEKLIENISKSILELKENKIKYNNIQIKEYERAQVFSKEMYYENFCKIINEM